MFGALVFLTLTCGSAVSPSTGLCSCVIGAGQPNVKGLVKEALRTADAVFIGSVATITDRAIPLPNRPSMVMRDRKVVMVFERGWKGALGDSVLVFTGNGAGDCGYPFQVGERYLVFAVASDSGAFSTGTCTLTHPLQEAAAYVRVLGDAPILPHRNAGAVRP